MECGKFYPFKNTEPLRIFRNDAVARLTQVSCMLPNTSCIQALFSRRLNNTRGFCFERVALEPQGSHNSFGIQFSSWILFKIKGLFTLPSCAFITDLLSRRVVACFIAKTYWNYRSFFAVGLSSSFIRVFAAHRSLHFGHKTKWWLCIQSRISYRFAQKWRFFPQYRVPRSSHKKRRYRG